MLSYVKFHDESIAIVFKSLHRNLIKLRTKKLHFQIFSCIVKSVFTVTVICTLLLPHCKTQAIICKISRRIDCDSFQVTASLFDKTTHKKLAFSDFQLYSQKRIYSYSDLYLTPNNL